MQPQASCNPWTSGEGVLRSVSAGAAAGAEELAIDPGEVADPPLQCDIRLVVANMRTGSPVIIGIAGGTGSGKTTIANKLAAAIPDGRCLLIEHDAYYRDRSQLRPAEREMVNYDHPDALESELLAQHLARLRAGESVDIPIYDYVTHTRSPKTRRVQPAPVIVVEGILVFVESLLREQFDIKLFVDTDADIRLIRRIRRDLEQRGRSFQSVREQYYSSVRPMHLQYVEPSKRWADLIIPEGGDNQVALEVILGKLARTAFDYED